MSLILTITDAGRQALINADNTGTLPLTISQIAVGSASYTPSKTQTALVNEIKRLTTFGGGPVAADTLHVTIQDSSSDSYSLGEFGLITNTGVLFAVCSDDADFILEKNSQGILLLSADTKVTTIDIDNLSFEGTNFLLPPGTNLVAGVLKLADTPTALAGTNNNQAMTPLTTKAVIDQHKSDASAHGWVQISGKPTTFPPEGHSHTAAELPAATTSQRGISQLNSSITSTAANQSATPLAVKTVNDLLSTLSNALFTNTTRKSLTITTGAIISSGTFYYWVVNKIAFFSLNISLTGINSSVQIATLPVADRPQWDTTAPIFSGKDSTSSHAFAQLKILTTGQVYLDGFLEAETMMGLIVSGSNLWRIA